MKTLTSEQQEKHDKLGFEYYFEPASGMMEFSQVRTNMMKDQHYVPYCMTSGCQRYSKTSAIGTLKCHKCGDVISYPKEFIDRFKTKHGI